MGWKFDVVWKVANVAYPVFVFCRSSIRIEYAPHGTGKIVDEGEQRSFSSFGCPESFRAANDQLPEGIRETMAGIIEKIEQVIETSREISLVELILEEGLSVEQKREEIEKWKAELSERSPAMFGRLYVAWRRLAAAFAAEEDVKKAA